MHPCLRAEMFSLVCFIYVFLQHTPAQLKQPGEVTDRTVLNVFASRSKGKRYILDSLKVRAVSADMTTGENKSDVICGMYKESRTVV